MEQLPSRDIVFPLEKEKTPTFCGIIKQLDVIILSLYSYTFVIVALPFFQCVEMKNASEMAKLLQTVMFY